MCKHELPYYEKLWICGCECNKGWKPVDLGTETTGKRRKETKKDDRGTTSKSSGPTEESGDDQGSSNLSTPGDNELGQSGGDEDGESGTGSEPVVPGDGQEAGGHDPGVGDEDPGQ